MQEFGSLEIIRRRRAGFRMRLARPQEPAEMDIVHCKTLMQPGSTGFELLQIAARRCDDVHDDLDVLRCDEVDVLHESQPRHGIARHRARQELRRWVQLSHELLLCSLDLWRTPHSLLRRIRQ